MTGKEGQGPKRPEFMNQATERQQFDRGFIRNTATTQSMSGTT